MPARTPHRSPPGATREGRPPLGGAVRRTVLPGGLRVVTEAVPGARSAAFGIWVGVGSRDETPGLAGASHLLEHLLFKGTRRRDALEIAAVMDAVGGELNAFTDKEHTCFYARVLDSDLPLAVDVVCDLVTSSRISSADVDSERGVVLEEIAMHDDDPEDVVHDAFAAALFGDAPLGRPVLGSVDSVSALSRRSVAGYYARRYTPDRMVVAAAGGLDHEQVVALVERAFAGRLSSGAAPAPLRAGRAVRTWPGQVTRPGPGEQAHLVLGVAGLSRDDPRRPALRVLDAALGGGMSSRLFQQVREQRALAYSVYSFTSAYADTGLLGVYAACAPARARQVLDLCRQVLAEVASDGLTEREVARAQGQLRGALVLGLEDTGARMSRLGKGELAHRELLDVEQVLARTDSVTPQDVHEVARNLLRQPAALAVSGPFEPEQTKGWVA